MNVHFFNSEVWYQLNEEMKNFWTSKVQPNSTFSVRIYPDLMTALYEVAQGLAQFYIHKKSYLIHEGVSPYIHQLGKNFLRAGFLQTEFQTKTLLSPLSDEELEKEIESIIKKDTLFSVMSGDHPITGAIYDWKKVSERLESKKVFQVFLQHHLHEVPKISPYSLHLIQGKNLCIAFIGERFKGTPLFTEMKDWSSLGIQINQEYDFFNERLNLINNSQLKLSIEKTEALFFQKDASLQITSRIFDRSLIFLKNLNSDQARDLIQSNFPNYSQRVAIVNLCDIKITADQIRWWDFGFDQKDAHRLLVLGSEPSQDEKFVAWLKKQDDQNSVLEFEVKV